MFGGSQMALIMGRNHLAAGLKGRQPNPAKSRLMNEMAELVI